jgi:hypothetical protein
LDLEATLAEKGPERDRAGAAEESRQVTGEGGPETLNRTLGPGQIHEHQASVRSKHTAHFPEAWQDLVGGKDVDEVTREDSVEGCVGKGKGRCTGLVEAISGMRNEI